MRTIEHTAELRDGVAAILSAPRGRPPLLAPDVEAALAHLTWLRQMLDIGVLEGADLEAAEIEGLGVIEQAVRENESKRRCPRCGAATGAHFNCGACGAKLPEQKTNAR